MYTHKLNFHLNQTTNIRLSWFISCITLSLSHFYNDSYHRYIYSHTKIFDTKRKN